MAVIVPLMPVTVPLGRAVVVGDAEACVSLPTMTPTSTGLAPDTART